MNDRTLSCAKKVGRQPSWRASGPDWCSTSRRAWRQKPSWTAITLSFNAPSPNGKTFPNCWYWEVNKRRDYPSSHSWSGTLAAFSCTTTSSAPCSTTSTASRLVADAPVPDLTLKIYWASTPSWPSDTKTFSWRTDGWIALIWGARRSTRATRSCAPVSVVWIWPTLLATRKSTLSFLPSPISLRMDGSCFRSIDWTPRLENGIIIRNLFVFQQLFIEIVFNNL